MKNESWQERRDRLIRTYFTDDRSDYSADEAFKLGYGQGRADALENSISKTQYDALHDESAKEVMRLHNLAASHAIRIGEMRKIVKNLTLELENVVKRISLEDLYLQDIIRIGYSTFTSESDTSPIEPLASISEDP